MNAYVKYFDKNKKYTNILVHNKEILKKCNWIWNKISLFKQNLFKKEFDSKPVYNDKYIKAKISLYNMNFYDNKTAIEAKSYTYFSVILLDSLVNVDKKFYPQVFLKEWNYAQKRREWVQLKKNENWMDLIVNLIMSLINIKTYMMVFTGCDSFLIIIIDLTMYSMF